jgi:hypothetical protein
MLLVTRDGSTWPARVCALPFGNLHPKLVMDSSLFPMKRAFQGPQQLSSSPGARTYEPSRIITSIVACNPAVRHGGISVKPATA